MYQQITVQTLHKQGIKKSQIARQIGCHRNTINNILSRKTLTEKQTRNKQSFFDRYRQKIKELLEKDVTRVRIHETLKEEHDIYSTYDALRKYVAKRFPKLKEAYGVQITDPGEEAELDFGYLGLLPGRDGKLTKTYGLAIILSYSRVGYYAICYDQKLETLCSKIKQALAYFGGAPRKLKVDNMKTAVVTNTRGKLDFNQDLLEFATHYTMVLVACTPYSPEQKGKVESSIKYMQGNFVNGRKFTDATDVAQKLDDWMRNYAN